MTIVTNETELENALLGTDAEIQIANDFEITAIKIVTRSMTIQSTPGNNFTLLKSVGNNQSLFNIESQATLSLTNITLDGNRENQDPTLSGSSLIFVNFGSLSLGMNTVLQNNISQSGGGAVFINDRIPNGSFKMTDNAVIRRCSAGTGGAIYAQMSSTSTFYIGDNAVIEDNEATLAGGGLWFSTDNRESMTIIGGNVTIARNKAYQGGGIYINDRNHVSSFAIEGATIEENTGAIGGGIASISSVISLNNVTLKNNRAENQGGAIYQSIVLNDLVTTIENSKISSNRVTSGDGGALYFENDYLEHEYKISIMNTEITENEASNFGGGIYNKGGSINLLGSSVLNNHASIGGSVYNE